MGDIFQDEGLDLARLIRFDLTDSLVRLESSINLETEGKGRFSRKIPYSSIIPNRQILANIFFSIGSQQSRALSWNLIR